jgi:hypothetical protein
MVQLEDYQRKTAGVAMLWTSLRSFVLTSVIYSSRRMANEVLLQQVTASAHLFLFLGA